MTRTFLRLLLLLMLVFTTALFVIHAQPYDHHELRELLLLEDCSVPCFMSIQPGVTTVEESLARLQDSEWIERVGVSESLETVTWHWSEGRTMHMDDAQLPSLAYDRDSVRLIRLYTRFALGDLLLALEGTSGKWPVTIVRDESLNSYHRIVFYATNDYVISATVNCQHFWDQPASLTLGIPPEVHGRLTYGLNSARRFIAVDCRLLKEL